MMDESLGEKFKGILKKLRPEDRYLPMFVNLSGKHKTFDIISWVAVENAKERKWEGQKWLFIKNNTMVSPDVMSGMEIESYRRQINPYERYCITEGEINGRGFMTVEKFTSNRVLERDYEIVEKDGKRNVIFLREIDTTKEVYGEEYG